MGGVEPPLRLRLEPRASRIASASLAAACSVTLAVLLVLPLHWMAMVVGTMAIAATLAAGLRRCTGRGVPALLSVGIDRRITVIDRNRRSLAGSILDDSYVGAYVAVVVWAGDGDPWWRPARAVMILPDTLPPDDFRRLRVALRYGRPPTAPGTSGVDAV
jgi:hypothetical protein